MKHIEEKKRKYFDSVCNFGVLNKCVKCRRALREHGVGGMKYAFMVAMIISTLMSSQRSAT